MDVSLLTMPQDEAEKQVKALKEVFKRNKHIKQQEIYTDMRRVYGHMQHGGKVIDIYQAFKNIDLDEDGNPKLAICRADGKQVHCVKNSDGSAIFSINAIDRWATKGRKTLNDVELPPETFKWKPKNPEVSISSWNILNPTIKTIVPLIPAPILIAEVKYGLKNYHILWEVEKWIPEPPIDPILLKQLTPNMFGVLATWDLTELERSIIRAHVTRE